MKAIVIFVAAVLLVGTVPRFDGAVIANSGSTNAPSWTLAIRSDGSTVLAIAPWLRGEAPHATQTPRTAALPLDLTTRFFADIVNARTVPPQPITCMKSVSFGTATVVRWHGWQSSDLSCPQSDARTRILAADIRTILGTLGITGFPPGRVPLPHDMHRIPPSVTPAPSATPTNR